ncbi:MAG: tetratricopeptide repeat protein, partial [Myxococcales bacterium]|nr:tetratricopeptide repeat protein [Myxococcales bacterium]
RRTIKKTTEAWPDLVRCLGIQADAEPEVAARGELLLRMGAIQAQSLADSDGAFATYARAFRDDPQNEIAQQALENIASIEERWQDFADLFEEAVSKDLPSDLMQALLSKLAVLYKDQLDNIDKAIACYERAVDIDPGNMDALDALEALYTHEQKWAKLLDVYRAKVDLELVPESREALRFQIARLQEEMLGQPESAIATYNEILADDDANLAAITALDRLYQQSSAWGELAENLARQLTLSDDAGQQIGLNLRLGSLRLRQLEQRGLAVETYRQVLDLDPTNDDASRLCEARLAAAGRLDALRELQERCARLAKDPAEEIRLRRGFAVTWRSRYDDPEIMAHHLRRAVELAYTTGALGEPWWHVAAYRALARRPEARADPDVLVALARRGLAIIQEPDEAAGLALLAATLADEAIGDPETTRSLLEPAVTLAPGHPLVRRPWPQAEP